jgi:hypothetical protein
MMIIVEDICKLVEKNGIQFLMIGLGNRILLFYVYRIYPEVNVVLRDKLLIQLILKTIEFKKRSHIRKTINSGLNFY